MSRYCTCIYISSGHTHTYIHTSSGNGHIQWSWTYMYPVVMDISSGHTHMYTCKYLTLYHNNTSKCTCSPQLNCNVSFLPLQADHGYMNCITLGKTHMIKLCALFPKLYSSYDVRFSYSSYNHSLLAVFQIHATLHHEHVQYKPQTTSSALVIHMQVNLGVILLV